MKPRPAFRWQNAEGFVSRIRKDCLFVPGRVRWFFGVKLLLFDMLYGALKNAFSRF